MPKLSPFLWFDTQAEEAANHYTSIFPSSRITNVGPNAPVRVVHHLARPVDIL